MIKSVEWKDGKVKILDQTKLPIEVSYIECNHYGMVVEAIKNLKCRGAPAIGIAAAMGLALAAQDIKAKDFDNFFYKIKKIANVFISTRPTAINIKWAMKRMLNLLKKYKEEKIEKLKKLLVVEAIKILEEDIEVNKTIGILGAEFIKDGDTILTHCNAGVLATGGYGTATAPILVAKEQGKTIKVIVDETRPLLQGARITTWELIQAGIEVILITDSSAGALMQKGKIDLCFVGADRVALNGDVANKIGTYTLSVLAKENKIPFYVASPLSSIDFTIPSGEFIPIEERSPEEVTQIYGKRITPDGVKVINMAFDITPARYITAIITEKGVFKPQDIKDSLLTYYTLLT